MTHIECTCRGLDPDCPFGAKNFTKDIVRLAGHRNVPPWVMKLVADAVAEEREACAQVCEEQYEYYGYDHVFARKIRARGNP